jgi:hypothetical protein
MWPLLGSDMLNTCLCLDAHATVEELLEALFSMQYVLRLYIASHLRVVPENVGLQKEQKFNTFACHTCNEMSCVLGIRKKEVGNTKR